MDFYIPPGSLRSILGSAAKQCLRLFAGTLPRTARKRANARIIVSVALAIPLPP